MITLPRLLLEHKLLQDVALGLASGRLDQLLLLLLAGSVGLANQLGGTSGCRVLLVLLDELLLELLDLLLGLGALLVLLVLLEGVLLVQLLESGLLL